MTSSMQYNENIDLKRKTEENEGQESQEEWKENKIKKNASE